MSAKPETAREIIAKEILRLLQSGQFHWEIEYDEADRIIRALSAGGFVVKRRAATQPAREAGEE